MKTKHLHMHVFVRIRGPKGNEVTGLWRCDCGTETSFPRKHGMYVGSKDQEKTRALYPDLDISWEEWLKHKDARRRAPTMWWVKS